jgi:glutamine synthetase
MLGSSASISEANVVLNTAVAESLRQFADELEKATEDFESALHELIKKTIKEHKRIIFNGNGYDEKWLKEAEKRGLSNLVTTPDALAHFTDKKNVELFETHKVYSEVEMRSRLEIMLGTYRKMLRIEALTMIEMSNKDIMPCVSRFIGELSKTLNAKRSAVKGARCIYEKSIIKEASALLDKMLEKTRSLEEAIKAAKKISGAEEKAGYYRDVILPNMKELRETADRLEVICDRADWPYPDYGELLFGV